MDNLSNFLQRFKKIIGDKRDETSIVCEVLKSVAGIELSPESVEIREGVSYLKVRSVERSEIALRKKEILSQLKERGLVMTDLR